MGKITILRNANIVRSYGVLSQGTVVIEDGIISDILPSSKYREGVDIRGLYLIPGFVDIHCDAIEKRIEPRPNVRMPENLALIELDKELVSCGITTIFHSISFAGVELGLRANSIAEHIVQVTNDLRDFLAVNTYVHARFEVTNGEALPILLRLASEGLVQLLSFMDHTPGQGQFRTLSAFKHYYRSVYEKEDRELDEIVEMKLRARSQVVKVVEEIANLCYVARIPMAVHDADRADQIRWFKSLGVKISEFPVTQEAAEEAQKEGLFLCLGAPNVLRGVSQAGNLSARELISKGLGSILCSDYSPMTLLHAMVTLVRENLLPLHRAVEMLSLNPAKAVKLDNRVGSIDKGKQADLLIVDIEGLYPRVLATIIRGEKVYSAIPRWYINRNDHFNDEIRVASIDEMYYKYKVVEEIPMNNIKQGEDDKFIDSKIQNPMCGR
ncbi:MAG: alpha-D-ribose 1-methylphosphonate 5-triphosphate diphosphatase [Syntrophobacterales bacterium]|nr:alpha-D-ribose 1-methylphosphonate 5-triphosphate diphosphatase [Syntrophobacterales bacterium]